MDTSPLPPYHRMMNEQLDIYRNLKEKDLRSRGRFIAEGRFLVERLLRSTWEVESLLASERMADEMKNLAGEQCPVHVLPDSEIEEITGFRFHRGVLAAGIRRPFLQTRDLLQKKPACSRLIICPDLTDAENLGSIIRSAAALGVNGLLIGPESADPLSRRALKVSMGSALTLPIALADNGADDISILKEEGFSLYGTVLSEKAHDLRKVNPSEKSALLLGNEARGLSDLWIKASDTLVTLPMENSTDSLNVSVAAGIFIYEMFCR